MLSMLNVLIMINVLIMPFKPHTPFRSQASNESNNLFQTCTTKNKALMATEASECKVPVNACCVVDEQVGIHDNAYACIIPALLCGHQPEVPCRVRWFLAIGSGSRGIGSGLCNDLVFLGLYQDVPFREWCFCDYGFHGSHYLG